MSASELPNLLVSRPNKPGEPPTYLLMTHRTGQVDFKVNPCKKLEDGTWEFCESIADPETTGNFRMAIDGSTLDVYATAPKKWVKKFVKEADGSYKCISAEFPGTTATPTDITPKPSLLGAGGLPKGMVNLGEVDEDAFDPLA